jgi:hypothetical protein
MKTSTTKKVLITVVTVTTIVGPLVPKSVTLNINMQPVTLTEKPYKVVNTTCKLEDSFLDERGHQVCSYKCKDGDNITVSRTMFNNTMSCQKTITERVKKTER